MFASQKQTPETFALRNTWHYDYFNSFYNPKYMYFGLRWQFCPYSFKRGWTWPFGLGWMWPLAALWVPCRYPWLAGRRYSNRHACSSPPQTESLHLPFSSGRWYMSPKTRAVCRRSGVLFRTALSRCAPPRARRLRPAAFTNATIFLNMAGSLSSNVMGDAVASAVEPQISTRHTGERA